MTTIDVNTGSFVGSTSLNETIVRPTWSRPRRSLARRIPATSAASSSWISSIWMWRSIVAGVMDALEEGARQDKARTRIVHLQPLGLVEMTRKRTGQSLLQNAVRTCSACEGRGEMPRQRRTRPTGARVEAAREGLQAEAFAVFVGLDIAWELIGDKGEAADRLEESLGAQIFVRVDASATSGKPTILQEQGR